MRNRTQFLSLVLLFFSLAGSAQKKPLDHSVYDSWQHIGQSLLSNDGNWVVYAIEPQEGDGELFIQSADGRYRKSIARGYQAMITDDSRFLVFKIKPFFKDTREARIKKKKAEDMPKDSLAIVELGKETIWKTEKVKNYKLPLFAGGWVAYQLDKPIEQPGKKLPEKKIDPGSRVTDSLKRVIDSLEKLLQSPPKKKKEKGKKKEEDDGNDENDPDETGDAEGDENPDADAARASDLVLRNLQTGEEIVFYKVLEYYFSKKGEKLLLEQARNPVDTFSVRQVLLYDCRSGRSITLSKGGNNFSGFAISDDAMRVAYVAERDAKPKDLYRFFRLWYYENGMDSARLLADRYSVGMKIGMTISEYSNVHFSKSGKRLFFGTSPILPPRDTSGVEFEQPRLDVWHYNDDYLQTVQTFPNRLRLELQQNFLAVYDLDSRTIRQLGSRQLTQVVETAEGDGEFFAGITDFGKRIESQWTGNTKKDVYAVEIATGEKQLVKENLFGQVYASPTGKYILWYDRKARHYFSWDGSQVRNITEKIKTPLWNEEYDSPDEPNNYGVMGWQENDRAVYIYDRYGVWAVDPTGRSNPSKLHLPGSDANSKWVYRYVRTDSLERFLSPGEKYLFRVFNEKDKSFALYDTDLESTGKPAPLFAPHIFGSISRAKNKPVWIYTRENYSTAPDLYISTSLGVRTGEVKLTAINPQQGNYRWGTAELFHWKAYNGKEATGIVYRPEDFEPGKKYPMIVYFYEKLSQGLYDYKEPAPIRSAINVPFFVSRGYIIFLPDIEYKIGHPGQSAYDYVVSGSRALVKKGWVDSTRIGIQGHSWGGYQALQLATMTRLFKAVWTGAPVVNMTSAYGGIRWESGVSRQFQYEKTQSRIGGSLWEKLPLYMENSPLFHLEKVTAPMVILANDADGAVPWYQGIELFTAMRRLGKKVWMLNYNGQGHGLTQRPDMLDYHIRMQQFFDWQLKGEKPARWLVEGVPAARKGRDWGLETVDEE
jgi:dipeptidyl aminopeptidase/acylaminoacyl peptidase